MLVGIYAAPDSPLASQDVRQALNYGIDVAQITEEWLKGYGTRYGSWVNPPANNVQLATVALRSRSRRRALDTRQAIPRALPPRWSRPATSITRAKASRRPSQNSWGELGITVQVEMRGLGYLCRHGCCPATPPPLFLLGMNSRGDALQDIQNLSIRFGFNPTGWQNEAFEEAVERAQNSFNENAQCQGLNDAQSIAYEEAPWIWLWRQYRFYGVSRQPRLDAPPRWVGARLRAAGTGPDKLGPRQREEYCSNHC